MLVPESGWWGSHTSRVPGFMETPETSHSRVSDSQLHFREPWNLQSQLRPGASEFEVPRLAEIGHKLFLFMLIISRGKNQKTTCRIWPGISISLWKNLKIPELIFSMKGVYCPRSRFSNVGVFHEWNFDSFLLSPSHWEDPSSQVTGDNVAIISMTFCHWYLMLLGWGGGEEKELFCRQFWFSSFLPNIPHNLSKINFTEIQAYVSLETYWTACE